MAKYQKKGEVKPVKKPSTSTIFNKYGETANKAMYRLTGTDTTKNQYAYDKSGKMVKVCDGWKVKSNKSGKMIKVCDGWKVKSNKK